MEKNTPIEATTKLVEVLEPLSSDERVRAIRAAMILLGEVQSGIISSTDVGEHPKEQGGEADDLPLRARNWMKQNDISMDQLQHVFHIAGENMDVIAGAPGKSKREQTHNAYVLIGLRQLLLKGEPAFEDKDARSLCESLGCYDKANHSVYLKNRGNLFAGSKDKGWTLTAPGLKHAAGIIKELSGQNRHG